MTIQLYQGNTAATVSDETRFELMPIRIVMDSDDQIHLWQRHAFEDRAESITVSRHMLAEIVDAVGRIV